VVGEVGGKTTIPSRLRNKGGKEVAVIISTTTGGETKRDNPLSLWGKELIFISKENRESSLTESRNYLTTITAKRASRSVGYIAVDFGKGARKEGLDQKTVNQRVN